MPLRIENILGNEDEQVEPEVVDKFEDNQNQILNMFNKHIFNFLDTEGTESKESTKNIEDKKDKKDITEDKKDKKDIENKKDTEGTKDTKDTKSTNDTKSTESKESTNDTNGGGDTKENTKENKDQNPENQSDGEPEFKKSLMKDILNIKLEEIIKGCKNKLYILTIPDWNAKKGNPKKWMSENTLKFSLNNIETKEILFQNTLEERKKKIEELCCEKDVETYSFDLKKDIYYIDSSNDSSDETKCYQIGDKHYCIVKQEVNEMLKMTSANKGEQSKWYNTLIVKVKKASNYLEDIYEKDVKKLVVDTIINRTVNNSSCGTRKECPFGILVLGYKIQLDMYLNYMYHFMHLIIIELKKIKKENDTLSKLKLFVEQLKVIYKLLYKKNSIFSREVSFIKLFDELLWLEKHLIEDKKLKELSTEQNKIWSNIQLVKWFYWYICKITENNLIDLLLQILSDDSEINDEVTFKEITVKNKKMVSKIKEYLGFDIDFGSIIFDEIKDNDIPDSYKDKMIVHISDVNGTKKMFIVPKSNSVNDINTKMVLSNNLEVPKNTKQFISKFQKFQSNEKSKKYIQINNNPDRKIHNNKLPILVKEIKSKKRFLNPFHLVGKVVNFTIKNTIKVLGKLIGSILSITLTSTSFLLRHTVKGVYFTVSKSLGGLTKGLINKGGYSILTSSRLKNKIKTRRRKKKYKKKTKKKTNRKTKKFRKSIKSRKNKKKMRKKIRKKTRKNTRKNTR